MGCSSSRAVGPSTENGGAGAKAEQDGPLTAAEVFARISCSEQTDTMEVPGANYRLRHAFVSQRGYYPDALNKANQDSWVVVPQFNNDPNMGFFGVFDGHGQYGDLCSLFVRQHLPEIVSKKFNTCTSQAALERDIDKHYGESFTECNDKIHRAAFDDSLSGTTAISVLVRGSTLHVANVGDSRAIIATRENGKLVAYPLSIDQTPFRFDERERVKACGARVMTMDQIEGLEPIHENWGLNLGEEIDDDGDPPRIWAPDVDAPGSAFTRSIGDAVAERLGVFAEPELLTRQLVPEDAFIVIASDGVFEFLTSQAVANMVQQFDDPLEACKAVVSEAYRLWLQYEVRTDDITMICLFVDGFTGAGMPKTVHRAPSVAKHQSKENPYDIGEHRPVRRGLSKAKKTMIMVNNRTALANISEQPYVIGEHTVPKTAAETARIADMVKANFLFQHLSDSQRSDVFQVMEKVPVTSGEVIIRQGDEGDKFYVIDSGEYEVLVAPEGGGQEQVVHRYRNSGASFGELALMYGKPRAATVRAATDGMLWALDRRGFRSILMKTGSGSKSAVKVLRSVQILQPLSVPQLQRLADMLSTETYTDGQHIIRQGDIGATFYIIEEGSCVCTVADDASPGGTKEVLRLGVGQYFGERALMNDEPRAANVLAVGPTKVMSIARAAFEEILGSLQTIIATDQERRERTAQLRESEEYQQNMAKRDLYAHLGAADFTWLRTARASNTGVLGSVRAAGDDQPVTLKVISKVAAVAAQEERQVVSERRLVSDITDCASIPVLLGSFQDDAALYSVLGAECIYELSKLMDETFNEAVARFYIAGVLCGLDALHQNNIIYRGVSPDLFVIDRHGYLQFTDFRTSKLVEVGKTYTLCGAPEYLAPELISGQGYSALVDYWALGILCYEMLCGTTPFGGEGQAESEVAIYGRIAAFDGEKGLTFPDHVSPAAIFFIRSLLDPSTTTRLGGAGALTVRADPWFKGFDWAAMEHRQLPAPKLDVIEARLAAAEAEEPGQPSYEPFTGDASLWAYF